MSKIKKNFFYTLTLGYIELTYPHNTIHNLTQFQEVVKNQIWTSNWTSFITLMYTSYHKPTCWVIMVVHIIIFLKVNCLCPLTSTTSYATTPLHNTYNSSIKGVMYTSMLCIFTNSLPKVINVNITKKNWS
jgi:hypothetical protein